MALIAVVSGRYSATFQPHISGAASGAGGAAIDQGICTDDGYVLTWQIRVQEVSQTDAYGQSLLETVYLGANWRLRYTVQEYPTANAANGNPVNLAWPYAKVTGVANSGVLSPAMGTIGQRGSDVDGVLVLTAAAGTPAAVNTAPATLTAEHVNPDHSSSFSLNFTSKARVLPVGVVLFPYSKIISSTSYNIWFYTT